MNSLRMSQKEFFVSIVLRMADQIRAYMQIFVAFEKPFTSSTLKLWKQLYIW